MFAIFKSGAKPPNDVLLGNFHVVAIFRENQLIKKWKEKYKKPTSWKNFMQNKARRKNFDDQYLQAIKQIVYGLNYYLTELGDCVYYSKNMPLFVHINQDWFIGIAPIIEGVDY